MGMCHLQEKEWLWPWSHWIAAIKHRLW